MNTKVDFARRRLKTLSTCKGYRQCLAKGVIVLVFVALLTPVGREWALYLAGGGKLAEPKGWPWAEPWRDWDKPIDPRELAAFEYAHGLKLPDSLPKPVPFDFNRHLLSNRRATAAAYFDHLCKTEAGEYIFKTVDKVDGLYQMRPRHESTGAEFRDLYLMEDPYGYVEGETEDVAFMFIGEHRYRYFEQPLLGVFSRVKNILKHPSDSRFDQSLFLPPESDDVSAIFWGYDGELNSLHKRYEKQRLSRYGYTWRGIHRDHDREFGIAGGELIVLDLQTGEILGVRRGFARTGTYGRTTNWEFTPVCPRYEIRSRSKDFDFSYWFIRKVLRPVDPVEWPDVTF